MARRLPSLPNLLARKIYKTGQTRGADDDVIYQNRVGRNSTVLIPFEYFDNCISPPGNNGLFENGFIVLIKPEQYFDNTSNQEFMTDRNLVLGENALLFYETRNQWNNYNPDSYGFNFANSRKSPLGGEYVARVPSTTSKTDEKIIRGFNSSSSKGAGIRVYEYASSDTISDCKFQLEYLFWCCYDSLDVTRDAGMTESLAMIRKLEIERKCNSLGLSDLEVLKKVRMIDKNGHTICPLCLEQISGRGLFNRLEQATGRDVPDLTVTEISLFHIHELRIGEFNHKPYNLGWGHHHCNVVCKDTGIEGTLDWMKNVILRNNL